MCTFQEDGSRKRPLSMSASAVCYPLMLPPTCHAHMDWCIWLATPWKTTITQHCYDSNRYDIASMDIERTFDAGIDGTGRSFGHMMALDGRIGVRQAMDGSVFGDDCFFGRCRLFKSLFLFWSRLRRDASCVCMCLVKTEIVVMSCLFGVCGCVGCGQWRQWCLARNAAMVKSWRCLLGWSARSCHRPRYGLGVWWSARSCHRSRYGLVSLARSWTYGQGTKGV